MTGLTSLVRLHSWILDEKRQRLVELEQLSDRFKGEVTLLEENLDYPPDRCHPSAPLP